MLNRVLFERAEVTDLEGGGCVWTGGFGDSRVEHIAYVLRAADGDSIRVGVLDEGVDNDATIQWRCEAAFDPPRLPRICRHKEFHQLHSPCPRRWPAGYLDGWVGRSRGRQTPGQTAQKQKILPEGDGVTEPRYLQP